MTVRLRNCCQDHIALTILGSLALGCLGVGIGTGYNAIHYLYEGIQLSKIQAVCCPVLSNQTLACLSLLDDYKITVEDLSKVCKSSPGDDFWGVFINGGIGLCFVATGVALCTCASPISVLKTWKEKITSCCRRTDYEEISHDV